MKKNERFELYVSLTIAILSFPALWLMTTLPEEFIGLPLLYLVFQLNWMAISTSSLGWKRCVAEV